MKSLNKTTILPSQLTVRSWQLVDLEGQTLGRVATKLASILMGKDKVEQSLNHDCGDYVVAINSDKIKVTGNKLKQKIYYSHSGYPGNLRQLSLKVMMEKDSTKVIYAAVRNMLPKNKLRNPRLKRLKIFKNEQHIYSDKLKNGKKIN